MTLRTLIEGIMEKFPALRANDKKLILVVWNQQGLELTQEQTSYILTCCANPETVRRLRQKIQEEGHLWPEKKQQTFC